VVNSLHLACSINNSVSIMKRSVIHIKFLEVIPSLFKALLIAD